MTPTPQGSQDDQGALATHSEAKQLDTSKSLTWMPYAKPTRRMHDSGYRMFEVGYISDDDTKKVVLYSGTDAISQDTPALINYGQEFLLRMDMNRRGYIRFFTFGDEIRWQPYVGSDASLELGGWMPGADDTVIDLQPSDQEAK